MNGKRFVKVALRYKALYLGIRKEDINMCSKITPAVYSLLERLKENGYSVSEELLHGLGMVSAEELADIVNVIEEVMGVKLNWSPLVKGWNVPTEEGAIDHFITWVANLLQKEVDIQGTTLPCGHLIPEGIQGTGKQTQGTAFVHKKRAGRSFFVFTLLSYST